MANVEITEFGNGETDYVAVLNANFAALAIAIGTIQQQFQSLPAVQSISLFLQALLGSTNTVLGAAGLDATIDGPIVTVSPGYVWAAQSGSVLQLIATASQDMTGMSPGTWYVCMDSGGNVGVQTSTTGTLGLYSFSWNGMVLTAVTRLCARSALVSL